MFYKIFSLIILFITFVFSSYSKEKGYDKVFELIKKFEEESFGKEGFNEKGIKNVSEQIKIEISLFETKKIEHESEIKKINSLISDSYVLEKAQHLLETHGGQRRKHINFEEARYDLESKKISQKQNLFYCKTALEILYRIRELKLSKFKKQNISIFLEIKNSKDGFSNIESVGNLVEVIASSREKENIIIENCDSLLNIKDSIESKISNFQSTIKNYQYE